jgi:hypothetical protein
VTISPKKADMHKLAVLKRGLGPPRVGVDPQELEAEAAETLQRRSSKMAFVPGIIY